MVGVYNDGSDGTTVHNIYDTDEFRELAEKAYEWNQKGYFIADANTITETRQTLLKTGNVFGYIGGIHPGTKTQEMTNAGIIITESNIESLNTPMQIFRILSAMELKEKITR